MITQTHQTLLAHDDTAGPGPLLLLLPGAGDLRSEYRFVVDRFASAGRRVVTADLPGHGDSPVAARYTVAATAEALVALIRHLDAGPAVVMATSFAPAAAVWAAAEHPDLIAGIVAISPHLHIDRSLAGRVQSAAVHGLLRGPWAGSVWARLYRGWYKASPPDDLDAELSRLRAMLSQPARRRAVRRTLTAGRDGVHDRLAQLDLPTLTIFGSADDHFSDPVAEAAAVATQMHGTHVIVQGAGHYPHVERPEVVTQAVLAFLGATDAGLPGSATG